MYLLYFLKNKLGLLTSPGSAAT